MVRISVIIVNHNGQHLLGALFASLAQQTRAADEVLLIDNASTDGSVASTRIHFPWVRVIESSTNIGFAEGANLGAAQARGEYVALLNSDTVVDPGWLAALMQPLETDARVGIVVSKIYLAESGGVIDCAGAEFNNLGFCWGRGAHELDRGQFDAPMDVPAATACAMAVRREALGGEPLFDRQLFMYYEELDLSLRIRGRGYRIVYAPSSIVHHKRSQTVQHVARQPLLFCQWYGNRNRVKLLAKYYPAPVLLRSLPLICLSLAYWDSIFLLRGGPRCFVRAVIGQIHFAWSGLRERWRGSDVRPATWLPWMTTQRLRDLLALRATFFRRKTTDSTEAVPAPAAAPDLVTHG